VGYREVSAMKNSGPVINFIPLVLIAVLPCACFGAKSKPVIYEFTVIRRGTLERTASASGTINQGYYLKAMLDKEARENSHNQAMRSLTLNVMKLKALTVIANNVKKSRITRDSAALDYISAEVNLQIELQSALLDALTYAGSVLNASLSLAYSERHFEYVMEAFRYG
jgi:hypothetical protein